VAAASGPDDARFIDTDLASSRYAVLPFYDRFSRDHILVEEARKYATVLECGCSNGFLSHLITAHGGPCVVGIERDAAAAEEARRSCERVVELDLNAAGWPEQVGATFDLVMFGDVLEHLVDPVQALQRAASLLNPGGRVLVSLPNVAHWTVRGKLLLGRFDYQAVGVLDATHLRFFTKKSARALLRQAGYRPIRFVPAAGGRFTNRFRAAWDLAARTCPGLFALQLIFLAERDSA
jgi:2-polyprenyl-3-methyl-5-hydroxy-6-metoxy-1,4-benzoquinol methylase